MTLGLPVTSWLFIRGAFDPPSFAQQGAVFVTMALAAIAAPGLLRSRELRALSAVPSSSEEAVKRIAYRLTAEFNALLAKGSPARLPRARVVLSSWLRAHLLRARA